MEVIFRNVSYVYNKGLENETVALNDISMCLDSSKVHGIIGPIGSGKSTLLELMNGIERPTSGDVGLVYQFPEKQFFCKTVGEEVSFSEKIYGHKGIKSVKEKTIKTLKMVGLDESYLNRSPFSLNSGEKRRVAIASVLISNPKLLILDEPTIGLDDNGKKKLMRILKKLRDFYSKTIIIVTHDVDMLYEIADSIVVLNSGKLVCYGPKVEVFSNVELLEKNNAPVPSVIKVEKLIYDKTGIDLGVVNGINDLVRSIAKAKDAYKEVASDEK